MVGPTSIGVGFAFSNIWEDWIWVIWIQGRFGVGAHWNIDAGVQSVPLLKHAQATKPSNPLILSKIDVEIVLSHTTPRFQFLV